MALVSTEDSTASPSTIPETDPTPAETGIKRDWVRLPATPDPSIRFNRIEEQLEISAGIQESNVEKMFSAFEAIENLTEVAAENQNMFAQLIEQMEKDRQENARRFDKLFALAERKLNEQKITPSSTTAPEE